MDHEIDLTKLDKQSGVTKPGKHILLEKQIIKDEVMIDKINQFSEDKYDQIASSLKINPFLPDAQLSEFEVTSLDEYYFNYKSDNLNLQMVIRNRKLPVRQKRRIIKAAFNSWIKDYHKLERDTTIGIKEQVSLLDDIGYKRFSIIFMLVFLLFMIINFILLFSANSVHQFSFLSRLAESINNKISSNRLLETVTVIAVAMNFLAILFGFFHNKVLREAKRQYMLTKNNVTYLYEQMKHEFMDKAKAAKKYYLRNFHKKKYKPYPLTKVDMAEYSIDNVKKYAQTATMYTAAFKSVSKKLNFFRIILIFGTGGIMLSYYVFLTIGMLIK